MVGAVLVLGAIGDVPMPTCLCGSLGSVSDAPTSSNIHRNEPFKSIVTEARLYRNAIGRRVKSIVTEARLHRNAIGRRGYRSTSVALNSSLTYAWQDWRLPATVFTRIVLSCSRRPDEHHSPVVVDEIAGQYEENFDDVEKHLLDYFTFKAVRTVLGQLYEMNPTQYMWFYNFVVNNKPGNGKRFLRVLVKERQELGERVMITRLHLFNKWVKRYSHVSMHQAITDQNLELMRERLVETVKWPSENDMDVEKTD